MRQRLQQLYVTLIILGVLALALAVVFGARDENALPTLTPTVASNPSSRAATIMAPHDPQDIFHAAEPLLNVAKDEALGVIAFNVMRRDGYMTHSAGPGYDAPWIRDSYAWGMIPSDVYPQLAVYTASELRYWMDHQAASGQWVSNAQSGYYDETAILICAALDTYRVTGTKALLAEQLPRLRKGWVWLRSNTTGRESSYLLWTPVQAPAIANKQLPVSVDWADQVARRNYTGQLNLLWYRATQSMAVIESVLGNTSEATRANEYAKRIKTDFNRLFWTTSSIQTRNAPSVVPFGHYRSWYPDARDYFELDTNFQAIVYGVADAAQTASILSFVQAHQEYLLGAEDGAPPPAKTVYGDYAPDDYAIVRHKIGDGVYHNAYWMSIGGLAARAYQRDGQATLTRRVLLGLAGAFKVGQPVASAAEWYYATGQVGGVASYQWSARVFLDALYKAYLGADDDWSNAKAENLRVSPLFGEVTGRIKHLGKQITIRTHGAGAYQYAIVNDRTRVESYVIPETLLGDGATIDLYLEKGK